MGIKLFGVNISKLIKDNIGPGVGHAILVKVAPGARVVGSLAGGTNPSTVSYPCRGFIAKQSGKAAIAGTLVESSGMKTIILIGDTIDNGSGVRPALGDHIIIENTTYFIPPDGQLDRDPAAATYTCSVRKL